MLYQRECLAQGIQPESPAQNRQPERLGDNLKIEYKLLSEDEVSKAEELLEVDFLRYVAGRVRVRDVARDRLGPLALNIEVGC